MGGRDMPQAAWDASRLNSGYDIGSDIMNLGWI